MARIAFIHDISDLSLWRDGLWGAINMLRNKFDIDMYRHDEYEGGEYSFVLGWGGFNSPVEKMLRNISGKKGLCIGGNAFHPTTMHEYDVLFYETMWYRKQIAMHPNHIHAFGVNTDIYYPNQSAPKMFDYLGVGSFSLWKRWEMMTKKKGNRFVIGEVQKDNISESMQIIDNLIRHGIGVSHVVDPKLLSRYYQASRKVYIPAEIHGGGERAILEARACGCEVEIEGDNEKLGELTSSVLYSHFYYANQLEKGIRSCL